MNRLRKGLMTLSFILGTLISFAQESITVFVPTAGGFSEALTVSGGNPYTVTNLTIIGNINAIDFQFINTNLPVLSTLDLSSTSITEVPPGAFLSNYHLTSIMLPPTIQNIGDFAFFDCKELRFSNLFTLSIKRIGDAAFVGCTNLVGDFSSFAAYNTLTYIGSTAFADCKSLNGFLTLPYSLNFIGIHAFANCSGFTGHLGLPNLTTIPGGAFMNCTGLNGPLNLSGTLTSIGQSAFEGCSGLTGYLELPNTLTTIEPFAFRGCSGFYGSLNIPNTVTSLGEFAFNGCLGFSGDLIIPNSITKIGDGTFNGCFGLDGYLSLPNNLTSIGAHAFNGCNFKGNLVIPSTVKTISYGTFAGNKFTGNLNIPSSVTSIGEGAFEGCGGFTGSLIIPNSITSISDKLFAYCNGFDGDLTIPNTITSIGKNAFLYCAGLNGTLTIPNSITTIKEDAFNGCNALNKIKIAISSPITINQNTFNETTKSNCVLIVPKGTKEAYRTANVWKDFTTIIEPIVISFNSQGGSAISDIFPEYNTKISAPTSPTKAHYTFGGWYKESSYTNEWVFSSDLVVESTTLYAKWNIDNFTLSFDSQGGSVVGNQIVSYNSTAVIPEIPSKTGYTFAGWYKEVDCNNAWDFNTDVVAANTTLYAKWTINTYNVTFNSNGGTPVASVTAIHNAKISEPSPPTRTGYTFDGWYINLSDDFSFNFDMYMITSNLMLQAKWIPNTYYVSFYSQGIIVNSIGTEYNTTIAKPEDPIRTGYVFNGWFKEPALTTSWNFSTDRVTSTISLYAKWTAITYTVTFNSQGGSSIPSVVVNHGAKVAEPTPPIRNGYTLRGWYNQPTDGSIWFFDFSTVTEDITLYAHWNINSYTITFDSKGGSAVASNTAEYNSTITAPSSPTRTGYTFAGWYKDEEMTSIWNFNSDVVTDNATLYAKWDINKYIVSFDSRGGSNVNYIEVNYNSTINRPADPTKIGYTFAGWFKDQSLTNEWNFSIDVVTNHMYLYAKWTINTYTVYFNTQGGSSISNITVDYNSTITAPSAPTKTGYTFDGWYKEVGCVNPWTFATDVVTSDITLYAKWNLSSDIETISGNSIKLYPNPAVSSLTIEGENIEEITIYSLIGAEVLQPAINSNEDKCSFSIDELESGIYFARIKSSGNKIATIKFMKR